MCYENVIFKIEGKEIPELYEDMENLSVELDDEIAGFFRLRIALQKQPNDTWTYVDDERFGVWKQVTISAGFESGADEIFSGYITRISPDFGSEPSQVTLEVGGIDNSVLMDQEEKIEAWGSKKDSDIAESIFALYKDIDFKKHVEKVKNTEIVHDEKVSTIIQRATDMQFLKKLARRNGYECFVEGTTGYFRPPQIDATPQKVLAVHFGDETNVLNFSIDVNVSTPANVAMFQLDRFTKKPLSVTVKSSEQTSLGKSDSTELLDQGPKPAQTIVSRNVAATGIPEMTAFCQALRHQSEWFVTGEGDINGNKYGHVLKPHGTVTIKGIGETYSGVYCVCHVTHTFSSSGYTQRFKVKRNGLQPKGSENYSGGNGGLPL